MKRLVIVVVFLLFSTLCLGQSQEFYTGFFPEASFTKKLKNEDRINFKIENQNIFFDNRNPEGAYPKYTHYRTDLMAFYDWRLNATRSVALGVFHRFQDGSNRNRIIQQFALVQRQRNLRISNRFRTDQTFTSDEKVELRFRYRLALELPLNGASIDPGENYLVLSNEPIFSLQAQEFEIENRLIFTVGKLYKNSQKLEWSLDYRTDGFIQEGFRTRLWLRLGYFYSF
jgi:hypothetical protein